MWTDLRNRGVRDIYLMCVDGLKGFPQAFETLLPQHRFRPQGRKLRHLFFASCTLLRPWLRHPAQVFPHRLAFDGTMKDVAGLRAAFAAAGVDLAKPAITSCGSGITAAILALGLERVGHRNWALYDGSWADWGMYDDLKVAKG